MKTILASAYAINPFKGSEDGMGWNFVLQIARFNKVVAITRENNQEAIENYMKRNPKIEYENITFLYYDLPKSLRFWKKGKRGAMLYYLLWQRGIINFVKKQGVKYDVVHNLNFHNDWTPSYLWKLDKPLVWGPVGHHPAIPNSLSKGNNWKDKLKDQAIWRVKNLFWTYSLALKKTVKNSSHILCMNSSIPKHLNLKGTKHSIVPSVASEDMGCKRSTHDDFQVLSVGRFVPLKGFDLTLKAFASFLNGLEEGDKKNCRLNLVGKGPQETELRKIAEELGVENYVRFIPWMDRSDLMKLYAKSKVFLFPSHEGAGMVVSEALSFGVPVVCLDNVGPGEFIDQSSGISVKIGEYKETVASLGKEILHIYKDDTLRLKLSAGARERFENYFSWDVRGIQLKKIYNAL